MWWSDDEAPHLYGLVQELLGENKGLPRHSTAVGSTWNRRGERVLFIGLDPRLDPRPSMYAPDPGGVDPLLRRLISQFGPLPHPAAIEDPKTFAGGQEHPDVPGDVMLQPPQRRRMALQLLAQLRTGRLELDPIARLMVPLPLLEPEFREQNLPGWLPPDTLVGFIAPIRLSNEAILRGEGRSFATLGSRFETASGTYVTTAGHLMAEEGELLYEARAPRRTRGNPLGPVAATTCPKKPDPSTHSAEGVDIAAIAAGSPFSISGGGVPLGAPQGLRREDVVSWRGAASGKLEGAVSITAAMARADDDSVYEHSIMVNGWPPKRGGRDGDSGGAVFSNEGELLGHVVGTEGPRERGYGTSCWFQMIDAAVPYLTSRCGPIKAFDRL